MSRILVLTGGRASVGPYGVDKMEDLGHALLEVAPAHSRVHRKVRDVIEHRSGRPIDKTIRSLTKVPRADIVLAFLEREALAASWAKANGMPPYSRKPLVMFACWLADELQTMPDDQRQDVVRQYRGVDLILVWSRNQIDILVNAGFSRDRVEAVSFGFAPELFPVASAEHRNGMVAIGSDRGRDYPTLLAAVRGSGLLVDLYTGEGNIRALDVPDEVTCHGPVPFDEYRRLVAGAAVVVVPTRTMAYPSGQTVALEAAATGACVVVSDTPAMREYFSDKTAVMVRPGDVNGWRSALEQIAQDEVAQRGLGERAQTDVRSRFTYLQMWQEVDAIFRSRGWAR